MVALKRGNGAVDKENDGNDNNIIDKRLKVNSLLDSNDNHSEYDDDEEFSDNQIDDQLRSQSKEFPSMSEVGRMFERADYKNLTSLLKQVNTKLPDVYDKYKSSVEEKEKKREKVINKLTQENEKLKNRIVDLKTKLTANTIEVKKIIRQKDDEIERWKSIVDSANEREGEILNQLNDFKNNGVFEDNKVENDAKFNLIEFLTGLKCCEMYEGEKFIIFTIKQRGNKGEHYYKLTIPTNLDQLESIDIIYRPIWDGNEKIKEHLPGYLCEELSFPSHTAKLFYEKIMIALK